RRQFPAVTVNQPVPPPFYTAVAMIKDGNTIVSEARKRIFVPQVVKVEMALGTPELFSKQLVYTNSATGETEVLMHVPNAPDVITLAHTVATNIQMRLPSETNVRVVGPNQNVLGDCKTLTLTTTNNAAGASKPEFMKFMNTSVKGVAYIDIGFMHKALLASRHKAETDAVSKNFWDALPRPIALNNIVNYIVFGGTHETGHTMGLFAEELGGVGWHYIDEADKAHIMYPRFGIFKYLGLDTQPTWKTLDEEYLRFILPAAEKEKP
ncbi:MAG: hypothetical protein FWG50_07575, partial [Kiritimatiellaeota bacterium]|nr:hypothetical protein [Kiritimatiellota bacterium]